MNQIIPIIHVADLTKAQTFYVDALGFEVDFEYPDHLNASTLMGIKRDEIYLHLSNDRNIESKSHLYIYVRDLQGWVQQCEANSIKPTEMPEKKSWGATEMLLKDPDGNMLRISEMLNVDE